MTTSAAYDTYGNPTLTTDARGVDTTITYGSVGGYSYLYPTQVETASNYSVVKRTVTIAYDLSTGLAISKTDVDNGNLKNSTNYDYLGRPVKSITADGDSTYESWTTTDYYDAARYVVVKSDLNTKGDGKKVATQFYDQLGRVRLSKTLEDASTQSATNEIDGIKVQTRYAISSGYNYQLSSNPYRAATASAAASEPTMGWTRSKSVNTGRHSEVETFSGASLPAPWGGNTSSTGVVQTDSDSNVITVTDQAGKLRRSVTNALGQLMRVDEPDSSNVLGSVSSPNQATSYAYDTLNNLTAVTQGVQTRTFAYNSLSRLTSATNPESGTISYLYDNNGNLTSKTDARGVETVYSYDALNRVTQRSYDTPIGLPNYQQTPNVSYFYDNLPNAKGKLTKVSSSVSTTEYIGFDILGRVTGHKQTTNGTAYTTGYTYNLSGALLTETYPSGRVVKNTLATNGDLLSVGTQVSAAGLTSRRAGSFVYTAAGAVQSLRLGNNNYETTAFNSRLQPTQIGLGTSTTDTSLLKIQYGYGTTANNGNVVSQTITVPGMSYPLVQNYAYDSLNRLTSATEKSNTTQTWKQEFSYDRYGNRNFVTGTGHTTTLGSCPVAQCNPTISSATNRITSSGYTFDNAGNTTADPAGRAFTYDGENKQVSVTSGLATLGTYYYDGDGKRVKKTSASDNIIFIYDAGGKLIEERNSSNGALITSYVYAGSRLLSTETSSGTTYMTADTLGTPRINTNGSGAVIARHDYHPFGEEIVGLGGRTAGLGYGADTVRKKFTGYERDNETDLDFAQARYYNKNHGRFTSVDPLMASAAATNPQTFNRYAYVGNNPVNVTDPSGMIAGDFYNLDGKKIGTDGVDDKKIYIVYDKDKAKEIEKTTKAGGNFTGAFDSKITIANADVITAVGDAVTRSNSAPFTGDLGKNATASGGFQEAGLTLKTVDGTTEITAAPNGATSDPRVLGGKAEISLPSNVDGKVHVHPSGEIVTSSGNNSGGGVTVIGGGTTSTANFVQKPSAVDISNALPNGTNIVVGARDKTVYFYKPSGNDSGCNCVAKMSLGNFLKIGRQR